MQKKRPDPRHTLAANLKALQAKSGLTGREIARRAKVDAKTVNNQLHAKYDPRLEQVEAVAQSFGLSYLDLLNPYFDVESATGSAQQLLELFGNANPSGRKSILAVAEMAAGYSKATEQPAQPEETRPARSAG